jgi:4-hydroxy-tetrahydrodipicolinate synthase
MVVAKTDWGLRGVIIPLITPFNDDLSVDYEGLDRLVDYFIEEVRCDGLVPCGTTGESATLSHQEHVDVIRAVVQRAHGRVPVIASTGSNSTSEAMELTMLAEELGADATLQVGPYYNKPTQEGHRRDLWPPDDPLQHTGQDQPEHRSADHLATVA